MATPPEVTFTIKNPSKHDADAFKLTVPISSTVADIQARIAAEYDGNPAPHLQTLIYAGKVLKDRSLVVKDIIQQSALSDGSHAHSMHLVVRATVPPAAASTPRASTAAANESHTHAAGNPSSGGGHALPEPASTSAHAAPAAATDSGLADAGRHARGSDDSSAGGSSTTSGQHAEDAADAAAAAATAGGAAAAGFAAPAGMPPMFVFGTHGSNSGLLYAGHNPAAQLGLLGPHAVLSAAGSGSSHGGAGASSGAGAALPSHIQHVPYPYMMNMLNPLMSNPMMAAAYQAAYSAALQSMRQQAGSTDGGTAAAAAGNEASGSGVQAGQAAGQQAAHTPMVPLTAPLAPAALLYYPAAFQQAAMAAAAAAAAAASGQQPGGQQQHMQAAFAPPAGPFPMAAAPFAVPLVGIPAHLAAQQAAAAAAAAGQPAAGAAAAAAQGNARIGLRQRFPQGFVIARPMGPRQQQQQQGQAPAAAAAAGGAAQPGQQPHGHRRYRTRTITFRISMRTLLQMLVFGMVLYQHCTWPRLCILLCGVAILYITALWPPFRQFVVSLARPPQPEQLAQMQQRRQQQAAQQQQQQPHQPEQQPPEQQHAPAAAAAAQAAPAGAPAQPAAPAAAAGAAQPAGVAGAQQAQQQAAGLAAGAGAAGGQPPLPAWLQQGPLREVLAVLVSFITSLFPAWNYNAEDAAVFAAAQEMLAREEQQQRQGQGQGQAAAGGANAAFP